MSTIKVSDLWNEVIKVSQDDPEFVYDRDEESGKCSYQRNGEPSCIVGHALHRLGVSIEDLKAFDTMSDSDINEIILSNHDIFEVDSMAAKRGLEFTQANQDSGKPWAEAVREGKSWAEDVNNDTLNEEDES